MVQPVITGKYGKKPKGFTDKEAKELNDNTVSTDTNLHGKDIGQPK